MPRYVKCRTCGTLDTIYQDRHTMEVVTKISEETGKKKNFYYHKGTCWSNHIKDQAFIDNEMKEKDELNEVIKGIYGIKYQIPPRIWELMQDLRNGTNRYDKFFKRKYKKGVPYSVMKEAFIMSKQDIEWARLNRRLKTTELELRYGLKIMESKIEDAYKKIKRTEQSQVQAKAVEKKQVEEIIEERQVTWRKQKSEFDISHILGDD